MKYISDTNEKINLIQRHFSALIGKEITGYGFPQGWSEEDKEWFDWMDLPVRLVFGDITLSISWTRSDELALEQGNTLPRYLEESQARWLTDNIDILSSLPGEMLHSVALGNDKHEDYAFGFPLWNSLILTMQTGLKFVIYNAGDENGFRLYTKNSPIEAITCCSLSDPG